MAPGQPHLLAGGVEGHRQAGQNPVPGAQRIIAQEQVRLGIDERRRTAVGHGHTLGRAGRAGSEDDPRVVLRPRAAGPSTGGPHVPPDEFTTVADDGADARCGPHQFGTVVRVIHVDGHVGRPDRQDGEDVDVELCGAGRDVNTHPVAPTDTHRGEPITGSPHLLKQAQVVQHGPAIVNRDSARKRLRRGLQDLPQCTRRRRRSSGVDRAVDSPARRRHRQAGHAEAGIELSHRHPVSPLMRTPSTAAQQIDQSPHRNHGLVDHGKVCPAPHSCHGR